MNKKELTDYLESNARVSLERDIWVTPNNKSGRNFDVQFDTSIFESQYIRLSEFIDIHFQTHPRLCAQLVDRFLNNLTRNISAWNSNNGQDGFRYHLVDVVPVDVIDNFSKLEEAIISIHKRQEDFESQLDNRIEEIVLTVIKQLSDVKQEN